MPRNGSGTSSVINTFVIDTVADPDEVNANFTDVADQLTNSLPRDGQAGMNAPLPLQNGTAALPALTFTSDPDTGFYRESANKVGLALGGVGYPLDIGVVYAAKSGNYTAVATDNNAVHRYTAAATVTLTAAATLGANWHYTIIADGGGVTIDPNGAETIDGAATLVVPDGHSILVICSGSAFFAQVAGDPRSGPQVQLYSTGLSLATAADAANDITIATGTAASDVSPYYVMALASSITKQIDGSWAVGNNAGGLDTGSVANSTYYIWLIQRSDTGVVDALFSLSSTAPTMPTNYDRKRLLGFLVRAAATNGGPINRLTNLVIGLQVASTSGTSIDFNGVIPANAKRITVMFDGTSLSASSAILVQMGTAAGLETSGYVATSGSTPNGVVPSTLGSSAGFPVFVAGASQGCSGALTLTLMAGNKWVCSGTLTRSEVSVVITTGGLKQLAGMLDRIRITSTGADTFDAGTVNIAWEL